MGIFQQEHELRIQLEGAWEVLEQVRARQSALLEPLSSRRWQRHLRKQPELVRQVRELESSFGAALARAEHRLEQGAWPERHPLALLTRQLHTQRARLETLVRDRLARLGAQEDTSFVEGLERLETKLREPLAPLLFEGEHVLLSIRNGKSLLLASAALTFSLLQKENHMLEAIRQSIASGRYGLLIFDLFPILSVLLPTLQLTGRFWLTPRRLVWKPILGSMIQLSLDAIPSDGITTKPHAFTKKTGVLRVKGGEKTLTLRDLPQLDRMRALLELHRRPLLFGRTVGTPTYPLTMFQTHRRPAGSGPAHEGRSGWVVVRSNHAAFLPERGFDAMLRALFGEWPNGRPEKLTLPLMVQQLSLLPEADFDRCMKQAVRAGGGEIWPVTP
jgi:hypothetical protein